MCLDNESLNNFLPHFLHSTRDSLVSSGSWALRICLLRLSEVNILPHSVHSTLSPLYDDANLDSELLAEWIVLMCLLKLVAHDISPHSLHLNRNFFLLFCLWTPTMCLLMLCEAIFFPHSMHSTTSPSSHDAIYWYSELLTEELSRKIFKSVWNSSSVLKEASLMDGGRFFMMSTRLIWWESAWSFRMSWLSETKVQSSHLIFNSTFFTFLHWPNLWHFERPCRDFISQNLHWYGFSPLWILKCKVSLCLLPNISPHSKHLCFLIKFTWWKYFVCSDRMPGLAALKGQIVHGQTTPSCLFKTWSFSSLLHADILSHFWQLYLIISCCVFMWEVRELVLLAT